MNIDTFDRYEHQPPYAWLGRQWLSTRGDGSGNYARGVITDVAPGQFKIRWYGRWDNAEEWVPRDRGTLIRVAHSTDQTPGP